MKIDLKRMVIITGSLTISLVLINGAYLLGYITKPTSLTNALFMAISDIIIFLNFDTIGKYTKSKDNTPEAIHWKYYLLKKIMTLK